MPTDIEWADETWEIVRGCTPVSPGCQNCYAARLAKGRLKRFYPKGFNNVEMLWDTLTDPKPARWRKPRRVFPCSRSDLFHKTTTLEFLVEAFSIMRDCPQHQFPVLTKRVDRMRDFSEYIDWPDNVWAGVSVEDKTVDWRIEQLSCIPAKVRFVSLEPLLGPVDIRSWLPDPAMDAGSTYENPEGVERYDLSGRVVNSLDWVIVGGESGPNARPMHPEWVRSVRNQCREAGVPLFVKQASGPRAGQQGDLPDDLWATKESPTC